MKHDNITVQSPRAGSILLKQEVHFSKKNRICNRCGKFIKIGDSYLRESYRKIDNLKTYSIELHLVCK